MRRASAAVGRLGEDLACGHHRGIGRQHDLIGCGLNGARLRLGKAPHIRTGPLGLKRSFVHLRYADGERYSRVAQDFGAAR